MEGSTLDRTVSASERPEASPSATDLRAQFDADVTFVNGGGLQAQGFRLDIPTEDIGEAELGELFVRHLGLLMVGSVRVTNVSIIREGHKGSRGVRQPAGADRAAPKRIVDLSHRIEDGMITYPGLPGPEIGEFLTRVASRDRYAPGTEFSIGQITMVGNTGTYMDSPYHRFADAADLAGVPLTSTVELPGIVVRVAGTAERAIDRGVLLPHEVSGKAVLIHTGWDRHWGTEAYGGDNPFLTRDAAEWLAVQGVALVGIDSLNIDDTHDGTRPAHTTLLAAGIPIVEHLTGLEALPPDGFRFHAAPSAVRDLATWPVRAYAVVGTD
jgi:kynurenine formamidase